jgi:uncharacterized membrane protein YfcA
MTLASLSLIGAAVFLSSFISGIFGIAGGMMLLGVLLVFFDVATGMVMFSLLTTAGNLWRVVTWRKFIRWPIWLGYVAGGLAAFLLLRFVEFVPSKALVYLLLGLMPYMIEAIPRRRQPSIEWRGMPTICGFVTSTIQLMAGNGGMFLDIFFQKSRLDRRTTIATKAFCQTFGNVARLAYFGTLGGVSEAFPLWAFAPAVLLAIAGTSLAPLVVDRMTDDGFRQWTRKLIFLVSTVFLVRAAWLFWHG